MKTRTIEEIEKAFREMGLSEPTWGQQQVQEVLDPCESGRREVVFIRVETGTTPLEAKADANLA